MHNRSSWQPQLFPIFHHHLAPLPTHIHSMHLMMMLLQLLLPPASCLPACHAVRLGLPGLLMTTGTAHLTGTPRPSKNPGLLGPKLPTSPEFPPTLTMCQMCVQSFSTSRQLSSGLSPGLCKSVSYGGPVQRKRLELKTSHQSPSFPGASHDPICIEGFDL